MARSLTERSGPATSSQPGRVATPHLGRPAGSTVPRTGAQVPSAATATGQQRIPLRPAWNATGAWQHAETLHDGPLTVVFRARPIAGGEAAYVLKRLQPHWVDDPRAVAMLKREAIVGQTVHHRNLVPVLDAGLDHEPYYVVTPLLEGHTLETLLVGQPRPALAQALWIVRQVADALNALDAAGWMHGDVKPSNIIVSPRGHVTLIDLGFARRRDEMRGETDRPLPGTPHYMAPEMLISRLRPDARSDLYSLGTVLYRMLAGRLPFDGDAATVLAQQLQGRPPALRALDRSIPEEISALVQRLLAKDPLRRPNSPAELVRQLVALELAYFEDRG